MLPSPSWLRTLTPHTEPRAPQTPHLPTPTGDIQRAPGRELLTGMRSAPRKLMAAGSALGSLEHLPALSRLLSLLVQGPFPRSSGLSGFSSSPS